MKNGTCFFQLHINVLPLMNSYNFRTTQTGITNARSCFFQIVIWHMIHAAEFKNVLYACLHFLFSTPSVMKANEIIIIIFLFKVHSMNHRFPSYQFWHLYVYFYNEDNLLPTVNKFSFSIGYSVHRRFALFLHVSVEAV